MRIYEVGFHGLPTALEEGITKLTQDIRSFIEKHEGTVLAEGAPELIELAYPMFVSFNGKRTRYDKAHFGWFKFELGSTAAQELNAELGENGTVLRHILFTTTNDDTKRPMVVREVRRSQEGAPVRVRREEKTDEPVNEEAIEKSIEEIVTE